MRPYYEEAGITIFHGDCQEILPTLGPVDLVLTDPPYGVGKNYGEYDDSGQALGLTIAAVLPEMERLSARRLITPGIGNLWRYPPADWVIAWFKPNAMTRAAVANANTWEPVLVYGCRGFGVDSVTVSITPQKINHPCPKPERLFRWLISKSTSDLICGTILDPFMGSGTTLRAAKDLGRNAIGIEIEEKYCEIAAKRLSQGVLDFQGVL